MQPAGERHTGAASCRAGRWVKDLCNTEVRRERAAQMRLATFALSELGLLVSYKPASNRSPGGGRRSIQSTELCRSYKLPF